MLQQLSFNYTIDDNSIIIHYTDDIESTYDSVWNLMIKHIFENGIKNYQLIFTSNSNIEHMGILEFVKFRNLYSQFAMLIYAMALMRVQ